MDGTKEKKATEATKQTNLLFYWHWEWVVVETARSGINRRRVASRREVGEETFAGLWSSFSSIYGNHNAMEWNDTDYDGEEEEKAAVVVGGAMANNAKKRVLQLFNTKDHHQAIICPNKFHSLSKRFPPLSHSP